MPRKLIHLPMPLLRDVSRSFYLTLRVLPSEIRPQIGLAYLLARTSDTIADTELLPLEIRLHALRGFRDAISGHGDGMLNLSEFLDAQPSRPERLVLEKCQSHLNLLQNLSSADRELVQQVLSTIISGQELDLVRF